MKTINLWEFQAESVDELRANMRSGVINQILCAPTGSGKTVMALHLIAETFANRKRAVFVCDRISLIDQTSERLDEYDIPHGVIQANHWRWRPYELIQVASAQTLARRTWPEADLIVVDEAHTIQQTTVKRIAPRDTFAIGLTATPFTRALGQHYDEVVSVTTTNKLIQAGSLSDYRVFAASEPDMAGAKVNSFGEWTDDEAAKRSLPIVGDCVAEYLKHGDGQKFIAFGVNVEHCVELQRQFMSAGVQCALYTYQTSDAERKEQVTEFRKPDSYIRGLISVAALAKGFDVPDVRVIIMARPLRKSLTEHIQILGRGLRAHPGKESCTVLDHAGNMMRFWARMQDFFEFSTRELDDGKPKNRKNKATTARAPFKCPKCSQVHSPRPSCPTCGFEYPRRSEVHHTPGELHQLVGSGVAPGAERQALYSQLVHICEQRGYKPGWAAHKFKERTGFWPNGLSPTPAQPTRATLNWVRSRQIAWAKGRKGR